MVTSFNNPLFCQHSRRIPTFLGHRARLHSQTSVCDGDELLATPTGHLQCRVIPSNAMFTCFARRDNVCFQYLPMPPFITEGAFQLSTLDHSQWRSALCNLHAGS